MTFKKIIGKLHLWLGLISGLVVFVVGLTGAILVFEEEISTALGIGVFQSVVRTDRPLAAPSQIFATAEAALKDKKIARSYYTVYLDGERVNALWALDSTRKYHAVLQDPYTGGIAGTFDYKNAFFTIVTQIHVTLLMGETGTTIISYGTLIFVILMITGIILWKPASRKGYRQRFTVKWNAKGKRLNYDLHNVLGFYMSWVAIFIALTGLVWSFEWVNNSVQWVANGGKSVPFKSEKLQSDTTVFNATDLRRSQVTDSIFTMITSSVNNIRAVRVYKPVSFSEALHFTVETHSGSNYARADDYFFDQYTGELLGKQRFDDYTNGEKLRRMNYYIHVGSIGGLTGKLLAFFASLIAGSLPVTGLVIWLGRKKRVMPVKRKPDPVTK